MEAIKDRLFAQTKEECEKARTYRDGKRFFLTVASDAVVKDLELLLGMKRKPKNDEVVRRPIQHFFERQRKKLHRQGARIPRTEAYFWYAAGTREEGEHSIWAFYEAVKNETTA